MKQTHLQLSHHGVRGHLTSPPIVTPVTNRKHKLRRNTNCKSHNCYFLPRNLSSFPATTQLLCPRSHFQSYSPVLAPMYISWSALQYSTPQEASPGSTNGTCGRERPTRPHLRSLKPSTPSQHAYIPKISCSFTFTLHPAPTITCHDPASPGYEDSNPNETSLCHYLLIRFPTVHRTTSKIHDTFLQRNKFPFDHPVCLHPNCWPVAIKSVLNSHYQLAHLPSLMELKYAALKCSMHLLVNLRCSYLLAPVCG